MEKVVNPKSGKLITIGGRLFNDLIDEGYIFKDGKLYKNKGPSVQSNDDFNPTFESKRPTFYEQDINVEYYAFPNVRCTECNKPLTMYNKYEALKNQGMEPIDIYETLNIKRPCCRFQLSNAPLEPFPYIDELKISDEPQKTIKKNPKLSQQPKRETDIIRLWKNDQLLGLYKRIDNEEGVDYKPYETRVMRNPGFKTTPVGGGKYYISSAK